MPKYFIRVPEVTVDCDCPHVIGKQGLCVRDDYRVIVNVKHAGIWRESLSNLMNIAASRQPRSYIDELLDAAFSSKEPDRSPEEIPVLPSDNCHTGNRPNQFRRGLPIYPEVVFAAEQMVVNSRNIRYRRIEASDPIVVVGQ
jgi:hypothetical protein